MKVCYVLSTSEITGGANRSLLDIISTIDRNKITPIVLIKKHGDIEAALRDLNIACYCIPYINSVSTHNLLLDICKRISEKISVKYIKKFLVNKEIELVHNNSLPTLAGMQAAKELNIPYVCHIREDILGGLGLSLLDKEKHFKIVNSADQIVVISKYVYEKYIADITNSNIKILYDGIKTENYLNSKKQILDYNICKIAIYGNIDPQKGQIEAIEAIKYLKQKGIDNVHLYIIGNSSSLYAQKLMKYVDESKIENIYFKNPIKQIEDLYASRETMDINLVCSRSEGLGRITIESMLAGCLTIGAAAGATCEIIKDKDNGLLYECGNFKDLAYKIEWAINHKSISKKIAKQGRDFALKKFGMQNYNNHILKIYENVMCQHKDDNNYYRIND